MTDDVRDPQLLKGVLPMLVLQLLTERESYGYELVTRLQTAGLTDIAAGTVYPLLTRLEREAAISSHLVASTSGPARKYYCPTPGGAAALAAAVRGWEQLARTVAGVLDAADPAVHRPDPSLPHGHVHSPAGTTSTPEEHRGAPGPCPRATSWPGSATSSGSAGPCRTTRARSTSGSSASCAPRSPQQQQTSAWPPRWTTGITAAGVAVAVVIYLFAAYSVGTLDTLEALGGGSVTRHPFGSETTFTFTGQEISVQSRSSWQWAALYVGVAAVAFVTGSRLWRALG